MVMPIEQQCPSCSILFVGSDALGGVCFDCMPKEQQEDVAKTDGGSDMATETVARDVVVISRHEKGFPQADLYRGGTAFDSEDWFGAVPDAYMTGGVGQETAAFHATVVTRWPEAEIRFGGEAEEADDEDDT